MNTMDRKIERKPWWKRRKGWLIAGIVFITLLSVLVFSAPGKTYRVSRDYLMFDTVVRDSFIDYTNMTGTIEPAKVVYLEAVEGGRVEEIYVEEGGVVDVGQPLVRLSNNNLLLEISNNEAVVARAINDLRTARLQMEMNAMQMQNSMVRLQSDLFLLRRDFRNNENFFNAKLISEDEYLKSKEAYETAVKQMEILKRTYKRDSIYRSIQVQTLEESAKQMEENQKYIRQRLSNLVVKSPVTGELANIDIEEGQVITYGMRIGKINILGNFKIRANIDEHYINQVQKGLIGMCEFRDEKLMAEISKIYSEVENGLFAVDFHFIDSLQNSFRIGQTCRIKLELGQPNVSTLVPKGPFFQNTGGRWVFVMNADQTKAQRRIIQLGRQNPDYYEVLDGLDPGERVIISAYDNFDTADNLVLK